jgi:hypothetical protein
MQQILQVFIKALDKLSEPVAIIALLLMVVVLFLTRTLAKQLPVINKTLGKQTTLIERMVYDDKRDRDA